MATAVREMTHTAVPRFSWQQRAWLFIGAVVVLSSIEIQFRPWAKNDLDCYYRAAVRVREGESPYRLDDLGFWHCYRYPPAFAYWMIPLSHFDVGWAGRIWFACNWLMAASCLYLALYLLLGSRPWPDSASAIALLSLFACGYFIVANQYQGQVSTVMALACLGWAACRRAGWNFSGGLLLAAGCALKLAPLALVPYLLVRKDWRGLFGVAVGGCTFLLTPVPWLGVEGTVSLHQEWARFTKETQVPVHNYRTGNQGLMGMLARLPFVSNGDTVYSDANLAALERAYPLIAASLAGLLYAWILWDQWRRRQSTSLQADSQRENLYLSLLFIYITLANPCAWRCNFVILMLPCLMLAQYTCQRRPGYALSRTALILLAVASLWPVVMGAANLVRGWLSDTGDMNYLGILKGRMPNESWSFGIWLVQGGHFWAALLVGGVACWISAKDSSKNDPRSNEVLWPNSASAGK